MSSTLPAPTIAELAGQYAQNKIHPKDVVAALAGGMRTRDRDARRIHAYVEPETVRPIHQKADRLSALWSVPIAIKDNICVQGQATTCASRVLKGHAAAYHATVVDRLLRDGAILYGRMNMDEFAFGSSCETSCYGPTRNPWDPDRVPGGSSGGSAAAVADGTALAALGSDTGGSIRQPAALCGVVGLKPTYGRVSRYGLIAFASSLDQIGPITRTVRDSALVMRSIAGLDPKDSTTVDESVPDYTTFLDQSVQGLKIGVLSAAERKGCEPGVEKAFVEAVETLRKMGADVREISLPHLKYSVSVYYLVAPSEASSNLARFDGVRYGHRSASAKNLLEVYENSRGEGFGAEAKRRILLGTFSLSSGYYDAYYLRAMKVRTKIKQDFDEVFRSVDVVAMPTSPTTAFAIGEKSTDPLQMYLSDIFTISANLAGIPGLSVPCGFDASKGRPLPVGLQLLGRPFDEGTLFQVGDAYERETQWTARRPA